MCAAKILDTKPYLVATIVAITPGLPGKERWYYPGLVQLEDQLEITWNGKLVKI